MARIIEIAAKVLTEADEDGNVKVAVRARVTTDDPSEGEDGIVEVQGLDSEGFEVENAFLNYRLAPGETKNLSDRIDMAADEYERIVEWQQKQ